MKKMLKFTLIAAVLVMLMLTLTAAKPTPTETFTLIQGLPEVMNVGDTATVVIQVESDQPFLSAVAMPDFYYPGRGVVAVNNSPEGTSRSGRGTSATLSVTFKAKSSTADFAAVEPFGTAPVSVVVGVRYGNGETLPRVFNFNVQVP